MPQVADVTVDTELLAMGKTKVFIKGDLYSRFEAARRKIFGPVALFIQCAYRGFRIRHYMKDVLEVDGALKKLVALAGQSKRRDVVAFKEHVPRATVMDMNVEQMGALLDKAMKLPIKLPGFQTYVKARAHLRVQADLVRQIQ